jgi:hypothetical protein
VEFLNGFLPYSGPAVAALIAGVISFSVTVLSKDQKTSEFRQAWIDGLRNDVAELAGMASATSDIFEELQRANKDASEFILGRPDDLSKMDGLVFRIRLRLNPAEHQKIIGLLDFFHDGQAADPKKINSVIMQLVSETQVVLKAEWSRVKAGELSFRVLKLVSLGVVIISVALVARNLLTTISLS